MPKKVAKIDAVFVIEGIGTVIAMPREREWSIDASEQIHRRERIQIRTPSGGRVETFIKNIEMINGGRGTGGVCFSLPKNIDGESIVPGSELWLERDGIEPVVEL
jgi:hypothetical protein